ncbi:MAG: hypothetical protein IPK50_06850 [Fibrobacterota bacterium]|nr:MAG: hypothetical protein IPK50_06850 [Fibrobacterota bacterium]
MNPASLQNASDASFYSMDPFDDLSFEMLDQPEPRGVAIGCAKSWDPALHATCPVVVAMKTTTPDPDVFHPYTHGHLLVSDRTTGALSVEKAWESGKMPAGDEDPEPVERNESTMVTVDWLAVGQEHGKKPITLLDVRFLSGSTLTDPLSIATGSKELRWEEDPDWISLRLAPGEDSLADSRFAGDPQSPSLDGTGVACVLGSTAIQREGRLVRWPLHATIRLEDSALPADVQWIQVHLVFTWLGSVYADRLTVRIPRRRAVSQDGMLTAHFFLDLFPLFQEPNSRGPVIPQNLHLLAFCGPFVVGPQPLGDLPPLPE